MIDFSPQKQLVSNLRLKIQILEKEVPKTVAARMPHDSYAS